MTLRTGMLLGMALTAAVAAWWLGAVAIAQRSDSDVAPLAGALLGGLWLLRALAVALLGVRIGHDGPWVDAVVALVALIVVPWPLVLLGLAASDVPVATLVVSELGLLACVALVAALGRGVHALPLRADCLPPLATVSGIALAAGLWWQRDLCLHWLAP